MKILSLDTTATVCTAAICDGDRLIAETTVNTGNTHSETLLPVIENLLKITNIDINDIDCYACSTGPGSFTGVRIGVATVKGLAYGKNKPCISVSTLEALANNLSGFNGILCPVMNARRNQVYNALFKCENGAITRLCPDRAISIAELDEELQDETLPVYLSGDGYDITLNGFTKTKVAPAPKKYRDQSAYSVALCALNKLANNETMTDAEIAPVYLRPSQAERERNERLGIT